MIQKFSDFKAEEPKKKYGYVKAEIDIPNWNTVLEIIDPHDLVLDSGDGGYAKNPHVTVLYGFHESIDQEVMKNFLLFQSRPDINIGKISLFENEEFDVVKLDVDSDDLRKMNAELKRFPHDELHDKYTPHLTIAYVKKGTGKKYLGKECGAPETATVNKLVYTGSNKNVKISVDI